MGVALVFGMDVIASMWIREDFLFFFFFFFAGQGALDLVVQMVTLKVREMESFRLFVERNLNLAAL